MRGELAGVPNVPFAGNKGIEGPFSIMPDATHSNDLELAELAERLLSLAEHRQLKIVTVESCTGGQLASVLTDVEGLSHMFDRALITYTENAKTELVGVPSKLIAEQGVVSEAVAQAMACGGRLSLKQPCLSLAITGYAGLSQDGGEPGLVYIAASTPYSITCTRHLFDANDRKAIRHNAVREALKLGIASCG